MFNGTENRLRRSVIVKFSYLVLAVPLTGGMGMAALVKAGASNSASAGTDGQQILKSTKIGYLPLGYPS
jgi:hypothetical protein